MTLRAASEGRGLILQGERYSDDLPKIANRKESTNEPGRVGTFHHNGFFGLRCNESSVAADRA